MNPFLLTLILLPILTYQISYWRAQKLYNLPALPRFYGLIAGLLTLSTLLAVILFMGWMQFFPLYENILFVCVSILLVFLTPRLVRPSFHARLFAEKTTVFLFAIAAFFAILITSAIVVMLVQESWHFFKLVAIQDFLFGTHWSPEISLESTSASTGAYGALPLFAGTALITLIAMIVGGPLGLMIGIYTSQYAQASTRRLIKPAVEILAGIPTIVYGFFALTVVAPLLHAFGDWIHMPISSESALGAGLVMGLMILPTVSSLCDDTLSSLPTSLKENALALGSTSYEAIRYVLIKAAFPGIMASLLLALSRAIGETMLVLMAASLQPNLTGNPLESVTTVTVQIVSLLTGDQEFNSAKTLSAFALAFVLFILTLSLNIFALVLVRRHAKRYDL